MKAADFFIYPLLCLFFLLPACRDDKSKNDYKGVSDLISSRNKARFDIAKNSSSKDDKSKRKIGNQNDFSKSESNSKTDALSSIILYEENVKIVGSRSDQILAKGVAYINKKGQIVRIKILKE